MPDTPLRQAFQLVTTSLPSGLTMPMPVITTRLSSIVRVVRRAGMGRLILDALFDVTDRVLDGLDLLGVVVGDLERELFLDRHHELHDVERVRTEVVDEGRFGHDLLGGDPELLHDDLTDLVLDCHCAPFPPSTCRR